MMKILNAIFRLTMILGSFIPSSHCYSQVEVKSFPEIERLEQNESRNLVVFLHTDWCTYCEAMKNSTLKNQEVQELLNNEYYFTALNGEQTEDIYFMGKTFQFMPTGYKTGIHELAAALGSVDGRVSYPTLIILNEKMEIIFQYNGFLNAKELKAILNES